MRVEENKDEKSRSERKEEGSSGEERKGIMTA